MLINLCFSRFFCFFPLYHFLLCPHDVLLFYFFLENSELVISWTSFWIGYCGLVWNLHLVYVWFYLYSCAAGLLQRCGMVINARHGFCYLWICMHNALFWIAFAKVCKFGNEGLVGRNKGKILWRFFSWRLDGVGWRNEDVEH